MNNLAVSNSEVSGQAERISAADKAINQLAAQGGSITAQVQVIRKATGQVENHTLVFTPKKED